MLTSSNSINRIKPLFEDELGDIRKNIASSMIGKIVSLSSNARIIARGMVVGVMVETGLPKIVVNGHRYGLNQVLSVTPASVNSTN